MYVKANRAKKVCLLPLRVLILKMPRGCFLRGIILLLFLYRFECTARIRFLFKRFYYETASRQNRNGVGNFLYLAISLNRKKSEIYMRRVRKREMVQKCSPGAQQRFEKLPEGSFYFSDKQSLLKKQRG